MRRVSVPKILVQIITGCVFVSTRRILLHTPACSGVWLSPMCVEIFPPRKTVSTLMELYFLSMGHLQPPIDRATNRHGYIPAR